MEIIIVLLPLAIGLGVMFILFFVWAVRKGQYDDLDTPRYRMLIEDRNGPRAVKKGKEE
jgi:cbb3-type cytochrome oxidase maturation protein